MQKIIDINSGVYLLEIHASKPFRINLKKCNKKILDAGYYYYSGSAQKNLFQRIKRHLSKEKNIYWHIDYITQKKSIKINTAYIFINATKNFECELVADLLNYFSLKIAILSFGNSDCDKCPTHLLYSKTKIPYSHFISRYQSIVRFIPSSNEML